MSRKNIKEDLDSDVSDFSEESDIEEIEIKPIRKKETILKNPLEPKKPKKEMTEKMKVVLAECRKKGRETRKANAALRAEEKALKEESKILRRLELEAKKNEIAEYKRSLLQRAGYITKDRKPYSKPKKRIDVEEQEEYEEELVKKVKKKPIVDPESESEQEPEPEPEIKRNKPKKPTIKPNPSVINDDDRAKPTTVKLTQKKPENDLIKQQMRLLFPNFEG